MKYNKLLVRWSEREQDFLITFPRSCDGSLINDYLFNQQCWFHSREIKKSLKEELENRGYDLKTLRFTVKLKESSDGKK